MVLAAIGDRIGHTVPATSGLRQLCSQPVSAVLAERGPWTLLLSGTALAAAIAIALGTGMWACLHSREPARPRHRSHYDRGASRAPFELSLVW